jgi:hypothetical protein
LPAQRRRERVHGRARGASCARAAGVGYAAGARVGVGDQHEIGAVRADPAPERVRLGVFAVRDAGRRELERRSLGIRDRNRNQAQLAVAWTPLLVVFDRRAHRRRRRVITVESADDQHRR